MSKQFSLEELAQLTQSTLVGNPKALISHVNTLESAEKHDATFLSNPRYKEMLKQSKAGVICIDQQTPLIEGKNFLISKSPSHTFQLILEAVLTHIESGFQGIHPTAVIHPKARIGNDVSIGPLVVIDQDADIGNGTHIYSSCSIGAGVIIGSSCTLYSGVIIREGCKLGSRVIIQPGAVIGSCGFGYTTDCQTGTHSKLKQYGGVDIEDDVEIGANTTIDRARFKTTRICKGTKIDNLVQIAHNVELGENNIIISQSGIAGSTRLGERVVLGAQAGVTGHLEIASDTQIAARGGLNKSIKKRGGTYGGSPVMPLTQFNRYQVHLRRIEIYARQIASLEKRIKQLEEEKNNHPKI